MLEILLGQIPEAIYFTLFMIYTKQLKEKRLLFVLFITIQYLLLLNIIPAYSIYSRIGFFITTYVTLKFLYKEKSQITDIFTLTISSIILIIFNIIGSILFSFNYLLAVIIIRILMFSFLFFFKKKLYKIQKMYKKIWNRRDKSQARIKSLTFRSLNLIIFNVMFYIINIGMLIAAYKMLVNLK